MAFGNVNLVGGFVMYKLRQILGGIILVVVYLLAFCVECDALLLFNNMFCDKHGVQQQQYNVNTTLGRSVIRSWLGFGTSFCSRIISFFSARRSVGADDVSRLGKHNSVALLRGVRVLSGSAGIMLSCGTLSCSSPSDISFLLASLISHCMRFSNCLVIVIALTHHYYYYATSRKTCSLTVFFLPGENASL